MLTQCAYCNFGKQLDKSKKWIIWKEDYPESSEDLTSFFYGICYEKQKGKELITSPF